MSTHHAPSVSYRLGRSRFLGLGLLALAGLGGGVQLAWWWQAPGASLAAWGAAAWALSVAGLLLGWQRLPQGTLGCQAGQWRWHSAAYPGGIDVAAPEVLLDLQRLLLVRMRNPAGARWLLWIDADSDPPQWLDLRRALFAQPHLAGGALPAPASSSPP